MFCPNCGKQIKDTDNFCRYCGVDVRSEISDYDIKPAVEPVEDKCYKMPGDNEEELVLYDVKKHWMSLFWSVFLTPVFFIYFWTVFLNTHSIFSWFVVAALILGIVYPVLRYNSDKIIITNKYIHIKIGALNPEEIDIPLNKADALDVTQTSMGKILEYGTVSFTHNSEKYDYNYIKSPEDIQYLIDNTSDFVRSALEQETSSVVEN